MSGPSPRRARAAFTLIEVLVSVAIIVVMLGFLVGVMDQTTRVWANASAKVEQFREARTGFERVTSRLSQATLNTYWDYDSPTKPTRYQRQSELRFITGKAQTLLGSIPNAARLTHSVFFNAPLGITGNTNYTGLENALNTVGFYLELADDSGQRPPFITTAMIPARWRFRLMEFFQPTENFSLYQFTSGPGASTYTGKGWFDVDMGNVNTPALRRAVAENVIAFVITPRLSKAEEIPLQSNATHSPLAPNYGYDSTGTNANPQLNPRNQLPPVVQLTMVAIDEKSAASLGLSSSGDSDIFKISTLFSDTTKFAEDITALEQTLATKRVKYRIFTTNVQIRAAKWSREQIK